MYVEIINEGECFSTTKEFIEGVYANREEWTKHNFYPKNGMVGEVIKRTPSAYIVKIKDGIFVPMTRNGIAEISYEEFISKQSNNICSGMNKKQEDLNKRLDDILGTELYGLPDYRKYFKRDILDNIKKLTCDFERDIFLPDLEESALIYAADICLEYQNKSGRELDPMTIMDIGEQVTDVYCELFSSDFKSNSKNICIRNLFNFVEDPEQARKIIENYYRDVNLRYAWT